MNFINLFAKLLQWNVLGDHLSRPVIPAEAGTQASDC